MKTLHQSLTVGEIFAAMTDVLTEHAPERRISIILSSGGQGAAAIVYKSIGFNGSDHVTAGDWPTLFAAVADTIVKGADEIRAERTEALAHAILKLSADTEDAPTVSGLLAAGFTDHEIKVLGGPALKRARAMQEIPLEFIADGPLTLADVEASVGE